MDIQNQIASELGINLPEIRGQKNTPLNSIDDALKQIRLEATELKPVTLGWARLSKTSRMLRPGTLAVVGGAPGTGKSFFSLSILMFCLASATKAAYLPLESDRLFYLRRLAAMIDSSFDALLTIEDDQRAEQIATEAVERVRSELAKYTGMVHENPSLPDACGNTVDITPEYVLKWVENQFKSGIRVIVIDPLAMIDFSGKDLWRSENQFIQRLVSLSYQYSSTAVLVAHTTKKIDGKRPEVGDLQGGASIGRLAASVILIQSHDYKDGHVYRANGYTESVEYNRTVTVAKSRNSEANASIAFEFGRSRGPNFTELGIITPKGKENPMPFVPSRYDDY